MLELQATIADMCIEDEGWKLTLGPIASVYVCVSVILRSYDCVRKIVAYLTSAFAFLFALSHPVSGQARPRTSVFHNSPRFATFWLAWQGRLFPYTGGLLSKIGLWILALSQFYVEV